MDATAPKPRRSNQNQNIVTKVRKLVVKLANFGTTAEGVQVAAKAIALLDSLHTRLDPVEFGRRGGKKTAERGPEYFRQIAAMRKTRAGGRPRKVESVLLNPPPGD